ncbi:MAG: hypothetical protein LBQ51_02360 [Desulfovibrio sp.]|nr:hypothetical protein [Desulfovibrio sp.]
MSRTAFGQDSEVAEHIEVRPFATVPAKVGVSLGRTINMGNYESARITVSVEIPCYREEVLGIYPKLFEYVADRLEDEASRITGALTDSESEDVGIEEIL